MRMRLSGSGNTFKQALDATYASGRTSGELAFKIRAAEALEKAGMRDAARLVIHLPVENQPPEEDAT